MNGITTMLGVSATVTTITAIICAIVGAGLCFLIQHVVLKNKLSSSKKTAAKMLEEALNEAKIAKKEAALEIKEETHRLRSECDAELKERRAEIQRTENRIAQREEKKKKKEEILEKKIENLETQREAIKQKEADIEKAIEEQNHIKDQMVEKLEKLSGLSKDEAKQQLIHFYEDEAKKDAAILVRNIEQEAKEEAEKKARNIVTLAIQKIATDQASEVTVSSLTLPSDEMKGRIIGREGRNIKALEQATGVDLIIDDTPEAVVLSCFDPV